MSIAKKEDFLININIIEGRHFAWPNMDSAVLVRIGRQQKCTSISYKTDCPFFNEYFSFEHSTIFSLLLDMNLTITVFQPGKLCRSKKTLGYVTMDVATLWSQPGHQFYHKWAIIVPPITEPAGGPRGYLKVDISLLKRGEHPKIPNICPEETDELEGNLLLLGGVTVERQRANYVFNVYRGQDLCKPKYFTSKTATSSNKDPPNSFIEIRFAGLKARTSVKKRSACPVWNESLTLTEFFPPLCQRIKINLYFGDKIVANKNINLRTISNDDEHGFLPTYGPACVHFYTTDNAGYVGKAILSFTTVLKINPSAVAGDKSVTVGHIQADIQEINFWKEDSVLLNATILNVNSIEKKISDKPICFELNFGNQQTPTAPNGSGDASNTKRTLTRQPLTKGRHSWYLDIGSEKPCLTSTSQWPDQRRRMYNTNRVTKITDELKKRLDAIEAVFEKPESRSASLELENMFVDAEDFIATSCTAYIDVNRAHDVGLETQLDKERAKLCIREMEEIINAPHKVFDPRTKKKSYENLQKLLTKLELLSEEAQECWPDIFLFMLCGNKRVAFYRCPAKDIVFSDIEEEKGKNSGMVQNALLIPFNTTPGNYTIPVNVEIFLWLGVLRHKNYCLDTFPSGFVLPKSYLQNSTPSSIIAEEEHVFQGRVHIYQGKFRPGSDRSGLCDPFVKVTMDKYNHETKVVRSTLSPVWDQTLIFPKLVLHGTKAHIKSNPPIIIMEVFDKDECCKTEFIGRCLLTPLVKLVGEPYKQPQYPPSLCWNKVFCNDEVSGEVLIVAEILQVSGNVDAIDDTISKEVVQIPSDIKPNMVAHRIEIIFWGVRNLKKGLLFPITKPVVILECASLSVYSDTILNAKHNLNFTQPYKLVEVSLPDRDAYAPPICLKMFDSTCFGRYTLAGTNIAMVSQFKYSPMTNDERTQELQRDHGTNALERRKGSFVRFSKHSWKLKGRGVDKSTSTKPDKSKRNKCNICKRRSRSGTSNTTNNKERESGDLLVNEKKNDSSSKFVESDIDNQKQQNINQEQVKSKKRRGKQTSASSTRESDANVNIDKKPLSKVNKTLKRHCPFSKKQKGGSSSASPQVNSDPNKDNIHVDNLNSETGSKSTDATDSSSFRSKCNHKCCSCFTRQKNNQHINVERKRCWLCLKRQRNKEKLEHRKNKICHYSRCCLREKNLKTYETDLNTDSNSSVDKVPCISRCCFCCNSFKKKEQSNDTSSNSSSSVSRKKSMSCLTCCKKICRCCCCQREATHKLGTSTSSDSNNSNDLVGHRSRCFAKCCKRKIHTKMESNSNSASDHGDQKKSKIRCSKCRRKQKESRSDRKSSDSSKCAHFCCCYRCLSCKTKRKRLKSSDIRSASYSSDTSSCTTYVCCCSRCCPKKKFKKSKSQKTSKAGKGSCSSKRSGKTASKPQRSRSSSPSSLSARSECSCKFVLSRLFCKKKKHTSSSIASRRSMQSIADIEDADWWTKYYASLEGSESTSGKDNVMENLYTLTIYSSELELQPEFFGFCDILQTFQMYKGKRTGDETVDDGNIMGTFKGNLKIYQWPLSPGIQYVSLNGYPMENGMLSNFYSNEPLKFLVRIYCLKGINLRPKDASGKSDPYIIVTMNDKVINDKANYIPKEINPIFGRCFELTGTFSQDYSVSVAVWDWDLSSADDLIGETKIDIENRYYTRHRAHCGIPSAYSPTGYCSWRDQVKPTQILEKLCTINNLEKPIYGSDCVKLSNIEYCPYQYEEPRNKVKTDPAIRKEELALHALRRWEEVPVVGCQLVPEYVETRSLYNPAKPGIEQGKLQMWIDIFPCADLPPPPQVDITPRRSVAYELRLIIYNTDDVILDEDDFVTGEKKSDIYVKGWIVSPAESQSTDVHYRSTTGEGSFNWRFIFRFNYITTENKMVLKKKKTLFSVDEEEFKVPCRLSLQVWDNDSISKDDFIGSVTLELARLPRGARTPDKCSLNNIDGSPPTINLFKTKRTRGWWPFRGVDKETKEDIVSGKVEAEFEILTAEDADKNPAGLGRSEPQPLPMPTRPESSFSIFRNPLKAIKYMICKRHRWKIIKFCVLIILIFVVAVGLYSFPGYTVKRLVGA